MHFLFVSHAVALRVRRYLKNGRLTLPDDNVRWMRVMLFCRYLVRGGSDMETDINWTYLVETGTFQDNKPTIPE